MSSPVTRHQSPVTHSDEVLVRVEGVSKKFCRSLKKSLWYGVCDIASELNPRRGNELQADGCKLEVANAQSATRNASEAGLLQPATANPQLSPPLRPGEFWAVNDVSFELRRGEPGGEVAARQIGAANPKGETSWQRANQCLGLIGHNGAGTQAAVVAARTTAEGSPQGAMSGSEQVNTTLLKMLNGLIKPDSGKITMRGRVARWSMQKTPQANGALIALGAGFNPILTGREPRPRMRGTEIDQPHVGPQGRASGVGESKYLHQWFGAGPFEKGTEAWRDRLPRRSTDTGAQMFYRLESLFFRILFAWEFKPVGG
jgi:lipopolysaccharide transport system ATP-binding protein